MAKGAIITVSREFGSGGRRIAKQAAQRLGIPFYDKELIQMAAEKSGLSLDFVEGNEERITSSFLFNLAAASSYYAAGMGFQESQRPEDRLFFAQMRVIRELADQGSCVIVGRCADYILRERENCINAFVFADAQSRLRRAVEVYGLEADTAGAEIRKRDKMRANHYGYYTGQVWGDRKNYHILLNSGHLGEERTARAICSLTGLAI